MENVNSLEGDLDIAWCNSIVNLNGLNNLTSFGKGLTLRYLPVFKEMEGLNKLQYIGESISLNDVDSLVNFAGLDSLETIVSGLAVAECHALASFSGLENLKSLGNILYMDLNNSLEDLTAFSGLIDFNAGLHIWKNPSLKTLKGLEKIKHVSGWLTVGQNSLKNMDGLNGVVSIGGNLQIKYNDSLQNINGLENLKTIFERLDINENPQLIDFSGLENLNKVLGDIDIYNNTSLQHIYGLQNLNEVGGMINIAGNDSLSQCDIFSVCRAIANGNGVYIDSNNFGCNDKDEVLLSCGSLFNRVSGNVFLDLNCNDSLEGEDVLFPYHILKNLDDTPFAAANFAGKYNKLLLENETYHFFAPSIFGYSSNPNNYTINTDSTIQWYSSYDFNLCPDSLFSNLKVTLEPIPFARPGFESHFYLCVENTGTYIENGILSLYFDDDISDNLTITNSSGGTISNNTISWEIDSLPLFQDRFFNVSFLLSSTTALGIKFNIDAEIELLSHDYDVDLTDNKDSNNITVVGSFDPNDKTVSQPEIQYSDSLGSIILEYLIRFQNTGNYPATFIEVLDTIPEELLDMRSLEMISASHDYELTFPEENVLKWRFDNINLPDSTTNEPESHGFVLFSIGTIPDLGLSDLIRNRAGIYFDFNEPVITNYAMTNFLVQINEINPVESIDIQAYPNPSSGTFEVSLNLERPSSCEIQLFNSVGNIVLKKSVFLQTRQQDIAINVKDFVAGIYYLHVVCDQGSGIIKLSIN